MHLKAYDRKSIKSFHALYGINYVQNGWMSDSHWPSLETGHCRNAKIAPSQLARLPQDYDTGIAVSKDCTIETGHCTSPAGKGMRFSILPQ